MCCWFSLVLVAVVFYQNAVAQLLDENCDIRIGYRVKNGYPPKTTQFMAALYNKSEFLCGGSLIHKQYVLTAAHCVSGFDEVTVHLGENNRSCPIPVCKHVLQLNAKVILNSQWEDCIFLNDIALLRLNREVKFEAHIRPICIILDENVTSDSQNHFTAFGWGMTEHRGLSDVLKAVELVRLSKYECYQNVGTICAGSHLGDTCRGDSGGPLAGNMVYRGKSRHIQFGIVSYGNVDCDGSNGVYTDLNAHKSWIASVVLESEPRLLNENCKSDWGAKVYVRLWEMSLFEHKFAGALITNQFVVTVASAFPDNFNATEIKVESTYMQVFDVEWVLKHPHFRPAPKIRNNIALIRLAKMIPRSDLNIPICLGLNFRPPTTWNALLYSANNKFLGSQQVHLRRIPDCPEPKQYCVEKPDQLNYLPYETPGSVIGTSEMFKGRERYLIAGIISHTQGDVIVFTNIQDHEKWITRTLTYT